MDIVLLDEIDSTNDYIKEQCEQGLNESMLVIAKKQTKGRGRQGKPFKSPIGGLYMSYVFFPKESIQESVYYSFIASVAVINALKELYGIQSQIKWINDIYYNDAKLGGILCQSGYNNHNQRYMIIGIGINIQPVSHIDQKVISLKEIKNLNYDTIEIATKIVECLQKPHDNWLNVYHQHLLYKDQSINYFNHQLKGSGILKGINEMGELLIDVGDRIIVMKQSDVSIRLKSDDV